jgi:putative glutamine amidotransferase
MNTTEKRKVIGIVGWKTGDNSFGVTAPYLRYLQQFGDVLVLGPTSQFFNIDLLVLPGGPDLSTHFYSKVPSLYNTNPDLFKEFFFTNNLKQYIDLDIPIFGICLGMQMLNVHFGGKLTQHISFYHPSSTDSRDELVHSLHFTPGYEYFRGKSTLSKKTKKGEEYTVNSLHHQAVCLSVDDKNRYTTRNSDLAPELDCVAFAEEGGVIEIITHPTKKIAGVQFHPEELSYTDVFQEQCSKIIIESFLNNEPIKKRNNTGIPGTHEGAAR